MKRTMYEAARHTPKRKAVRSNRAGDARNHAGKSSKIKAFRRFFIYSVKEKIVKFIDFH